MPALRSGARCKSTDRASSLAERRSDEGVGPAPVPRRRCRPFCFVVQALPVSVVTSRIPISTAWCKSWPALERARPRLRQRPRSNQLAIPEPAGPPAGDGVYLSLAAAADLLGVTLAELDECIRLGKLETVRMGDQVLVRRASLDHYLAPIQLAGGRTSTDGGCAAIRALSRSPAALSAGGGSSAQAQASDYQGPDWNLDSFVKTAIASSVLAATVVRLAFEPGRASLHRDGWLQPLHGAFDAGKGRFRGPRFGQPRCPRSRDHRPEAAFLTGVQAARRYAYQDGRLILTEGAGTGSQRWSSPHPSRCLTLMGSFRCAQRDS